MRLAPLALGAILVTIPARAQTYDPGYPVCLHVYGEVTYYECGYTSLAQCKMSASGRAALCVLNPYFAATRVADPAARHQRHHQAY